MTIRELIERLGPTLGGELVFGDLSAEVVQVGSSVAADRSMLIFAETGEEARKAVSSRELHAAAVVVPQDFKPGDEPGAWNGATAVIAAKQPRLWFAKAAKLLAGSDGFGGIHPAAVIAEGAVIGEGSSIGAGAVVGDGVRIGRDCRIYPRAVIYPNTELGDRVVVHAGAVLGADGFGYVRDRDTGAYTQFPQQGKLLIEDDVEIGANTTIDRGALHETRIRRGTKIDNLVHIGHNCDIGEDVVIAAQTGISGSSTVGAGAVIAGQVGVGDHAHIGPGVILGGQAGVLSGKTLTTTGTVLWGTPAKPLKEYLRELAALARLARKNRAQGTGNRE